MGGDEAEQLLEQIDGTFHTALRQGDVQPGQAAPGLPGGGVGTLLALGEVRQRLVPAL